jgi:IstB-like ATP binding protein
MSRSSELTHLFRAMKAPAAARALPKLAERAREEEWSYERFAEALLSTEISSRESSGGRLRIRAARFPAHKTLEEFDFTFQRSIKKQVIEHLGQLDFLHAKENVILLGPPGTGKTPPEHRAGDPCLPRRPAGPVPHRDRMGRNVGRRAASGQAGRGTGSSGADPLAGL